jgi:hypothetical protein
MVIYQSIIIGMQVGFYSLVGNGVNKFGNKQQNFSNSFKYKCICVGFADMVSTKVFSNCKTLFFDSGCNT